MIGLGIAWRAATAGLSVTVVDEAPGRGASWAAAGMLAPVTEVHYGERPLLGLNLAAATRWPAFAAEVEEASGQPVGYRLVPLVDTSQGVQLRQIGGADIIATSIEALNLKFPTVPDDRHVAMQAARQQLERE